MAQKKIGAKIVIDGEQEFRSALNQSKNALKEFDSELKLVTSQFKNNEKSMEALRSKQAVYQKQQQELAKQSKLLVEQIQKASVEYQKASTAQEKQAEKIKKLEKALEEAKKEYGDSADEVKELEQELSEANDEYEKQERAIVGLSNKISKWNTDLNNTKRELNETDEALNDTNKAIENYDSNINDAENETKDFGQTMGKAGENTEKLRVSLGSLVSAQVVVDVLRNCARAIKEVASAAIDVGAKFEASMSKVEALSGASGDSLARLSDKAKEMGRSTIYSASESADAFSYMALAGWKVEDMLDGIEPVLNLAAAANMDLAEASDIVTDYITAFGLSADDASHFADAMATAMSTSNTTVELLGESYKNCAATCGSMGIAMEDATAVLATMANAGVKGGEAGTALNTILTRLATNTKGAASKLEEYGVAVYDAEGNMNSISSILNGLSEIWGDLSDKEQAALAKTIAGTSQYSKFQTIMLGVSDAAKDGGQSFDDYAEALRNCEGAAEGMAKVMQDNLQGDITILQSALEGLEIATEGVFDESFRKAVQGATEAVGQLENEVTNGELGVSLAGLGEALADITQSLIDAASDALPGFIDALTWIVDNIEFIGAGISTVVTGIVAYKVATTAATIATEGFTAALGLNPIALVAAGIVAATAAVLEFDDAIADNTETLTAEEKAILDAAGKTSEITAEIYDAMYARKQEVAEMNAQAEAARKLVEELFDETTTQERRAQVIGQLNTLYPELNLQLDEQGKLIGSSREELEKYIDTSLQAAKVEAARSHLTEIAKEQFDAEQQLAKVMDEMNDASDANVTSLGILGYEYATLKVTLGDLEKEYQTTLDYISENEPYVEAAEAAKELADAEEQIALETDEMAKEFEELEEAIRGSIENSLDLTNKWSQEWKTSTSDMTSNIDSQIEGIQNWADNFEKLANSSEVAIDDRVMKYLADMGTEGAGLVQQLVDTLEESPEQLQAFSDSMAEYLTLQDSVSEQITESYVSCVENGINGAADAISNNTELTAVTQQMADEIAASMTNVGHDATSAMQDAITEGTSDVAGAAGDMGKEVVDAVTKEVGKNGEKVGNLGPAMNQGIADGLGQPDAPDAAEEMSAQVYDAVASNLSSDAGYSIGIGFMEALANAIDEAGEKVLEKARAIAAQAAETVKSAAESGGEGEEEGEEGGGGEQPQPQPQPQPNPSQGAEGMGATGYAPPSYASVPSVLAESYIQTADALSKISDAMGGSQDGSGIAQVNVELSGSASDIFTVVRNQNTKLVTATGYHALS